MTVDFKAEADAARVALASVQVSGNTDEHGPAASALFFIASSITPSSSTAGDLVGAANATNSLQHTPFGDAGPSPAMKAAIDAVAVLRRKICAALDARDAQLTTS